LTKSHGALWPRRKPVVPEDGSVMAEISPAPDVLTAFLRQAQLAPSLPAVDDGCVKVSYAQLSSLAYHLAVSIQLAAAGPNPRVLLALPPSHLAYASMIASLIGGGTFCPIHVVGPDVRNAAICRAFAPDIVFYEKIPPAFLDGLPVTPRLIDVSRAGSRDMAEPVLVPSDVAYVVFTSGSTGEPKGVKVGRRGFSHFLEITQRYFNIRTGERWGQFSNLGHDLGVMDVFMALTHGGTLVPLTEAERFRPGLAIRDRCLSIWQSVPSVIELMMRANHLTAECISSLRIMSFCGEPLHPHHLDALFKVHPKLQVFNTYGTTETTGFNTFNRLTSHNYTESCDAGAVAIGDDVPGWGIHLLGDDTPNEGEIVVASEFLSLGYWCDDDRSRVAFRDVEFADSGVQRSYFTGDRGVRRGSRVYCLGRMDRQVKIRGERIELDEIDALLRKMGFTTAYTIIKDDELFSFVESSEGVDQERVRALLAKSLPFHAVPKTVKSLPSLPMNTNGKIDREALSRVITSSQGRKC
jgi:amino acid adenylation domain-containing protein